jgi:hypothetical protein
MVWRQDDVANRNGPCHVADQNGPAAAGQIGVYVGIIFAALCSG